MRFILVFLNTFLFWLNTFLLALLIFVCLTFFDIDVADVNSRVFSEEYSAPTGDRKIVNQEYRINFDVDVFKANFVSDGLTDSPSAQQKERAKNLMFIPLPVEYKIDPDRTKLILQGEVEYQNIPDTSKPADFSCRDDDSEGCFKNVTSISIFSFAISNRIDADDVNLDIVKANDNDEGNIFLKFVSTIREAYDKINLGLGYVLANYGKVDPDRFSTGVISYWGDDDFQQIVRIEFKGRKALIAPTQVDTKKAGVSLSENLFPTDLSNTVSPSTESFVKRPAWGLALNLPSLVYIGLGDVYDPFSPFINEEDSQEGFVELAVRKVSDFIFRRINQSNLSQFGVKKIAHEVPIRVINDSNELGMAFSLVEAVSKHYRNLPFYPNPLGRTPPRPYFITPEGLKVENPDYQKWLNYESLSPDIKRTLTFLDSNAEDKSIASNCARNLADDPSSGCDEFSVEESGFNFGMREGVFPVGLTYSSWTAIFNQFNNNLVGPHINPLSPTLCGRLQIGYNISPAEKYVYRISAKNSSGKFISRSKGILQESTLNTYCVVGANLANFSKSLLAQSAFVGTRVSDAGRLPLDRASMTCDKKEREMRPSSYYVDRNIPYSHIDDSYTYLSFVSFSVGDKANFNDCKEQDNGQGSCRKYTSLSFYVAKGDNHYATDGFPTNNHNSLFYYASPENDFQLILDNTDSNRAIPKYIFFVGAKSSDPTAGVGGENLQQILCRLVDYSDLQNARATSCIPISSETWGFPKGSALSKVPVEVGSNTVLFDLVTLLYEEDNSLKYKFIVIDPEDFNNHLVLGGGRSFELFGLVPAFARGIQDFNGQLVVGAFSLGHGGSALAQLKVVKLVANPKLRLNQQNKLEEISFENRVVTLLDNLCSVSNICGHFSAQGSRYFAKIGLFAEGTKVHVAGLSNGLGFILNLSTQVENQRVDPLVFSYVQKYGSRMDDYDEVSAFRYDPKTGDYYVFTGRAGYFLHLFKPQSAEWFFSEESARNVCLSNNCLITIQQYFDPDQFVTDTSNYYGREDAFGNSLGATGLPIVYDFDVLPNGDIAGVYSYSGLRGALFYSDDITYSFRGVYKKLPNSDTEVSNVYGVSVQSLEAIPIRYFNWKGGGLRVDVDVTQKPDSTYKEVIGYNFLGSDIDNIRIVYRGYDIENRIEYINCLKEFALRLNSSDPYSVLTGLLPVPLSTSAPSDEIIPDEQQLDWEPPGTDSSNSPGTDTSDSGYVDKNIGIFCEETWCIPDYFKIANSSLFGSYDEGEVEKFIGYLKSAYKDRGESYFTKLNYYIPRLCKYASTKGIPCSLLIAIWVQESSARFIKYSFGCFLPGAEDFESQYKCAANTIYNKYVNEAQSPANLPNKKIEGNTNQSGFKTMKKFVPGSCIPGTMFSYVMQRYTPIDQRINVDNQCNRGLVLRDEGLRGKYCDGDRFKLINGLADFPEQGWGSPRNTRPNLRRVISSLNELLPLNKRIPITDKCFPGGTGSNPSDSGSTPQLEDFEIQGSAGVAVLNLGGWGESYGAVSVAFAANRLEYGPDANPTSKFGEGGGSKRYIVIKPGGIFSYNDEIGNAKGLPDFMKEVSGTIVGAGWCDLATAVRLAAEKVRGPNGEFVKSEEGDPRKINNQTRSYGVGWGYGGNGDIFHWTHTSADSAARSFRAILDQPKDNFTKEKFVSIFIPPDTDEDADLLIRNSSSLHLILDVDYQPSAKKVLIKWFYAKKKS